jgi:SdpI/YfhL protein family
MTIGTPPAEVGWILAAVLLVIAVVSAAAGRGAIRRNPYAGIRLPPLQRSEAAWRAGHAAAVVPSIVAFVVTMVASAIAIALPVVEWAAVVAFVLGAVWAVTLAARRANAA